MKHSTAKKMLSCLMAVALLVMVLPQTVGAETKNWIAEYATINFDGLQDWTYLVPDSGKCSDLTVPFVNSRRYDDDFADVRMQRKAKGRVTVSFSDPSIATCSVGRETDDERVYTRYSLSDIRCKKFGTTTMTVTIKVRNSVKTYSCNLTFQKYDTNPVKSFKLDNQEFASAFQPKKAKVDHGAMTGTVVAKMQKLTLKKKQNKVKINVKLKKGYKLVDVCKTSGKKVKNGKIMKLANYEKDEVWMYVEYLDPSNSSHVLCMGVKIKRK